MPRMKELQDLLAELDAEGGLNIGGAENGEPANLDDLYEDSYFHAILHKSVKENSIKVATNNESKNKEEEEGEEEEEAEEESNDTTTEPLIFNVLTLPRECSWGDDHESLGHQMLVRPGYSAVLTALTSAPASRPDGSPVIYMAAGSSGIGKSCLAYYLAFKLFELGHDIVISDPMFTNAFLQDQYYSCYSPHLTRHQAIFDAISSAPSSLPSEKPIWWICDDGYLPVRHTQCHVLVTTTTTVSGPSQKDVDIGTIRKRKLGEPTVFHIPKWSIDEIKAGLLATLSESPESVPSISPEQEAVLEGLFKKFKSNPRKIFGWVKTNWVTPMPSSPSSAASFPSDASSLLGSLKTKKSKKASK
ncbi:hypothetical protein BGZ93_008725 [Podila epicladia]|nr:hypothetical protein BGZ92_008036 [Podila epicladia]KAG0091698.1 hypothetical protein BGZ93_008725 [Podila epicladia]